MELKWRVEREKKKGEMWETILNSKKVKIKQNNTNQSINNKNKTKQKQIFQSKTFHFISFFYH